MKTRNKSSQTIVDNNSRRLRPSANAGEQGSLVAKALSCQHKTTGRMTVYTDEEIELCIAWAQGVVSMKQFSFGLGLTTQTGGAKEYHRIAMMFRQAIQQGKLVVK